MRILYVTENFPPFHNGGAEISCELITKKMAKKGHDVWVITNSPQYGKYITVNKNEVNIKTWDYSPGKNIYQNYQLMKKVVEKINPDIIHVHLFENQLPCALMLAKHFPLIYTAHNYTLLLPFRLKILYFLRNPLRIVSKQIFSFFKHVILVDIQFWKVAIESNIPYIKKIIAPSSFMKQSLVEFIKQEKTSVIYNGIAVEKEKNNFENIEYNAPERIIFAGRIERSKGLYYLLRALKELQKTGQGDYSLTIIGKGGYQKRIIRKFGKNKSLYILGHLKGLNFKSYNGVVVYPSIWDENCSMTILEALAAGKIVITTNKGGNQELVQDLFNGLLIDARSHKAIVHKIMMLQENPGLAKYLAFNAKMTAKDNFSIEQQAQRIETLYKEFV